MWRDRRLQDRWRFGYIFECTHRSYTQGKIYALRLYLPTSQEARTNDYFYRAEPNLRRVIVGFAGPVALSLGGGLMPSTPPEAFVPSWWNMRWQDRRGLVHYVIDLLFIREDDRQSYLTACGRTFMTSQRGMASTDASLTCLVCLGTEVVFPRPRNIWVGETYAVAPRGRGVDVVLTCPGWPCAARTPIRGGFAWRVTRNPCNVG